MMTRRHRRPPPWGPDVENLIAPALSDLRFRHVDAFNTGDTQAFADNFTADGVWDVPGSFSLVGRTAIREKLAAMLGAFDWIFQVNHDAALLSASADEARARVYFVEHGARPGPAPQFVFGVYDEVCVREAGGWRYARRTGYPLYRGAPDLLEPIRRYPAPPA